GNGALVLEAAPVAHRLALVVHAERLEGAVALVVDEDVARDQRAEALVGGAEREVVVLEVADAEALVEAADPVDHRAADEDAEADDAQNLLRLAGMGLAPAGGERVEPVEPAVRHLRHKLRA